MSSYIICSKCEYPIHYADIEDGHFVMVPQTGGDRYLHMACSLPRTELIKP